ncbi:MAG TPA: hypothetical protein VN238_20565 [Solirubrobacteraceae bacterium]|nr:hypothetical protein [Solirubrobacteraceae bacterium]
MAGPSLIDRQFWLLGRDALHPDGNLLVAAGFTREAPPTGRPEASRYRSTATSPELVLVESAYGLGHREPRTEAGCLLADGPRALHDDWERYADALLAPRCQRERRTERVRSATRSVPSLTSRR